MSKKSKMRWGNSDHALINKVIKNFNAKLTRLEKKGMDMSIQPDKMNKKEVLAKIETRADFNRVIKSAQAFTVKGAETPVKTKTSNVIAQWHVNEMKKLERADNIKKALAEKRLNEQEVLSRGKGTGVKRAEMGTIQENAVKQTHKDPMDMTKTEFEKRFMALEGRVMDKSSTAKKQLFHDNYVKAMIEEGYAEDLIELVKSIPLDEFINTVDIDQDAQMKYVYNQLDMDVANMTLRQVWEAAADRSGIDTDEFYNDYYNHLDDE